MDTDILRKNIEINMDRIKQIQHEIGSKTDEIVHILRTINSIKTDDQSSSNYFLNLKNLIAQTIEKKLQILQLLIDVQSYSNKLDKTMAITNHNHHGRLYYDRLVLLKLRKQSANFDLEKIPLEIRRYY
ncbi:hypothetical protein HUG17_4927 [Dermatophagoides farinae]|uniref:Uncharacterized protein n=1 Tax=Dermatophagoides farinae TaxID=6954 RepID=A0A9D4P0R4_DERFA|nr:hypothetical protein HUG17_4927 [Dermatophagoides farinae]